MTTDNFCFYLQNRLVQTSRTGGQWYSDTSPFSIPAAALLEDMTGVEVTDSDKYISLLKYTINYGRKKFYIFILLLKGISTYRQVIGYIAWLIAIIETSGKS
jgi:hypothetical protein